MTVIIARHSSERGAFLPMLAVPSEQRRHVLQLLPQNPIFDADLEGLVPQMHGRGGDIEIIVAEANKTEFAVRETYKRRSVARVMCRRSVRDNRIDRARCYWKRKAYQTVIGVKGGALYITNKRCIGHVENGVFVLHAKFDGSC
jgi:hypothetical protein